MALGMTVAGHVITSIENGCGMARLGYLPRNYGA